MGKGNWHLEGSTLLSNRHLERGTLLWKGNGTSGRRHSSWVTFKEALCNRGTYKGLLCWGTFVKRALFWRKSLRGNQRPTISERILN